MHREVAAAGDYRKALETQRQIVKCESLRRREAILMSAQLERSIKIDPMELDRDPFLLNALNGTIDLRTGRSMSRCGRRSLRNARMVAFLQRAIGWALTGDMSEQEEHVPQRCHGDPGELREVDTA